MSKRLFDFTLSLLGLLVLMPVLLFVMFVIKLDSKGPVFFRQERVGRFGEPFLIHKFRTMHISSEIHGTLTVGKDSRITQVGYYLRKLKIDELPQLFDVLVGNMSFVGPRPEVPEFVACYPENDKNIVLSVRPGITDKASIEMVDENEVLGEYLDPRQAYIDHILPMKLAHYVDYVENSSFMGDLKIITQTFYKIVDRRRFGK